MNLSQELKQDIQVFVYFLFKGTNSKHCQINQNYVHWLISNREVLYNCFEVFAYHRQYTISEKNPVAFADEYILASLKKSPEASDIITEAIKFNQQSTRFWIHFLRFSKTFCFNAFPATINTDYLHLMENVGTDAAGPYALWTNVLEIDENQNVINPEYAVKRVNDYMLWFEGREFEPPFAEWELQREIY